MPKSIKLKSSGVDILKVSIFVWEGTQSTLTTRLSRKAGRWSMVVCHTSHWTWHLPIGRVSLSKPQRSGMTKCACISENPGRTGRWYSRRTPESWSKSWRQLWNNDHHQGRCWRNGGHLRIQGGERPQYYMAVGIPVYIKLEYTILLMRVYRNTFIFYKTSLSVNKTSLYIFITHPLVEAIADENNRSSSILLLEGIEWEKATLRKSGLPVNIGNAWRRHNLRFYNSMIDEKLDKADGGLQDSGSKFLCTLCHATRETAKSELGSFRTTRKFEETDAKANYMLINPDDPSPEGGGDH